MTPQEVILWQYIKNSKLKYKFRRQHSVGFYIADFYCPKKRLIIELDGGQHFEKEAMVYDAERTKFFEGLDMNVLRFTNKEVNENISAVIDRIKEYL